MPTNGKGCYTWCSSSFCYGCWIHIPRLSDFYCTRKSKKKVSKIANLTSVVGIRCPATSLVQCTVNIRPFKMKLIPRPIHGLYLINQKTCLRPNDRRLFVYAVALCLSQRCCHHAPGHYGIRNLITPIDDSINVKGRSGRLTLMTRAIWAWRKVLICKSLYKRHSKVLLISRNAA